MSSSTKNSRKRKATIDDNGEPVAIAKKVSVPRPVKKFKKAPTKSATQAVTQAAMTTAPSRTLPAGNTSKQKVPRRSVSVEDMFDEQDHLCSNPPRNPVHILEPRGGDNENENDLNDPRPMDVDDDDDDRNDDRNEDDVEDDEAELCLFLLLLYEKLLKPQ